MKETGLFFICVFFFPSPSVLLVIQSSALPAAYCMLPPGTCRNAPNQIRLSQTVNYVHAAPEAGARAPYVRLAPPPNKVSAPLRQGCPWSSSPRVCPSPLCAVTRKNPSEHTRLHFLFASSAQSQFSLAVAQRWCHGSFIQLCPSHTGLFNCTIINKTIVSVAALSA